MSDYMIGMDGGAEDAPAIVVQVQADGSHTVLIDDLVCKGLAAELLEGIAERLRAAHGPRPCVRPPLPTGPDPSRGRIDRERKVWRDPRGNRFDLSLQWVDQDGRTWRWDGMTGLWGEPFLRAEDGEVQPLGVLRAVHGPISPVSGGVA